MNGISRDIPSFPSACYSPFCIPHPELPLNSFIHPLMLLMARSLTSPRMTPHPRYLEAALVPLAFHCADLTLPILAAGTDLHHLFY
ncbi:hypothetical protein BD779DRAFT_1525753 [Infundibulicybe gibba]|nr:hypothetical protein BD779DRAFT_1525753 [Infundibulicybe gibba]